MAKNHRNHPAYWAFAVHRLSGLALALFLPVHFYFLGHVIKNEALKGAAALDGILAWTDNPLAKLAEAGLVILLAAHLTGGARLLAVEFLPWRNRQKTLIVLAGGVSLCVGLLFLINVV